MSISSTALSKHEKKRARLGATATEQLTRKPTGKPPTKQLLFSRKQASEVLGGVSLKTLKQLEADGVLKPVRLNRHRPTGQVIYAYSNLMEVAQVERDDDED